MADRTEGVLVSDGFSHVLLHRPEPYPGGHGFTQKIEVSGGPFRGSITADSYASPSAFRVFHEELLLLYNCARREVRLPSVYDAFDMTVQATDYLGHFDVVVVVADLTAAAKLKFHIRIDQTHLPDIIAAVERYFLQDPNV